MTERIPILMYHAIEDGNVPIASKSNYDLAYATKLVEFGRQMRYLSENGYCAISLDHYCASILQHCSEIGDASSIVYHGIPERPIIITFDDGHISNYAYAFPILHDYGFAATFFVTVKNINSSDGVDYRQLREMADNGMSIQSHTMTHPFLSDLSPEEIRWELQESKSILEENLSRQVDHLALPGGRCNSAVRKLAMEVGYQTMCTSAVGHNHLNSDLYSLKRWAMRRSMALSDFSSIVRMRHSAIACQKTRYLLLSVLKKVLGNQRYAAIRDRLL